MKTWLLAGFLAIACLTVYWPHNNAEFILDDYYTVVRNPLIKDPALYMAIWTSRLFDAHHSSGYIKYGYYRPVLQSSWIIDYRLFALKANGFQWVNLLIHIFNCLLIYVLLWQLFGQRSLALKACFLFSVLPSQEWVVRYVTGRSDELSALFALVSLISLLWVFKTRKIQGYFIVFIFWALSALTREVAISYILYALLIYTNFSAQQKKGWNINDFCLWWVLIGTLPLLLIWSVIPKQGNILILHVLYFVSIGACLWLAQLRLRWVVLLFAIFSAVSFYQGQFWTKESTLLRHTRSLEFWPRTVAAQQLLMKYDDDIPGIKDMVDQSQNPIIKSMWLRRLGVVYFEHRDIASAEIYFSKALELNTSDVDTLDALAVISHYKGEEGKSLEYLKRALEIYPNDPDTLRTLGVYYYIHRDFSKARYFISRSLIFDPVNIQARQLLGLVNKVK